MRDINYYPMMLNIYDKRCVVVGGGRVAARKIRGLISHGARVLVISPSIVQPIEEWMKTGSSIEWMPREYKTGDLSHAALIIGASDKKTVNEAVSIEAQAKGIPVNIVDQPALCTFILPAILKRGDLKISVSTNGKCPGFAKLIRDNLEDFYEPGYEQLLNILGEVRTRILNQITDPFSRKALIGLLFSKYEYILSAIRKGIPEEQILEILLGELGIDI